MPDPEIQAVKARACMLSGRAKQDRDAAKFAERDGLREISAADELARQARNLFADAAKLEKSRLREIRLIQVAKRALAVADDSYRALCRRVAGGVASSGDMTAAQRRALIAEFKRIGFRPKARREAGRRPANIEVASPLSKIEAQLTSMGLSWRYAEGILRHMRGYDRGIACPLSGASRTEQYGLIAALHAEQEKRQLLAAVDRRLKEDGQTRAGLAQEWELRKGWERHRQTLHAIHHRLYGENFRLNFEEKTP